MTISSNDWIIPPKIWFVDLVRISWFMLLPQRCLLGRKVWVCSVSSLWYDCNRLRYCHADYSFGKQSASLQMTSGLRRRYVSKNTLSFPLCIPYDCLKMLFVDTHWNKWDSHRAPSWNIHEQKKSSSQTSFTRSLLRLRGGFSGTTTHRLQLTSGCRIPVDGALPV